MLQVNTVSASSFNTIYIEGKHFRKCKDLSQSHQVPWTVDFCIWYYQKKVDTGIKNKHGRWTSKKWHFIELRQSTVLRSYSDNANLSEWIDLVYLFIPTRGGRRLCHFFRRIVFDFAYNGQTESDRGLIFSPLHCINITCTTTNTLYLTKKFLFPKISGIHHCAYFFGSPACRKDPIFFQVTRELSLFGDFFI